MSDDVPVPAPAPLPPLPAEDEAELREAVEALERPGLAMRLALWAGQPIELAVNGLPASVREGVDQAAEKAMRAALMIATTSLGRKARFYDGELWHKAAAAATGAVGGAGGWATLSAELPVTTGVMLRSIAAIARAEGEDLSDPATQLACLEVFGLGAGSRPEAASDSAYFTARAALTRGVGQAAAALQAHAAGRPAGPAVARLVSNIASRFGVTVSEKAAAQAVPVLGAVGGATLNLLFISHFQDMAQGHFTVRRLERAYGEDVIRQHYERFRTR